MAQSGMMQRAVARALGADDDSVEDAVILVPIVTTGDRIQDRRLMDVGGKALFTKEIEQALIDGRIDLAVHSLKDVPADMPPGLVLAAIPEREITATPSSASITPVLKTCPTGRWWAPPACAVRPSCWPRGRTCASRCCAAMWTPA